MASLLRWVYDGTHRNTICFSRALRRKGVLVFQLLWKLANQHIPLQKHHLLTVVLCLLQIYFILHMQHVRKNVPLYFRFLLSHFWSNFMMFIPLETWMNISQPRMMYLLNGDNVITVRHRMSWRLTWSQRRLWKMFYFIFYYKYSNFL